MSTMRPGAYIREGANDLPASITDSIKNVGIVGKGSPYYAVNNVAMIKGNTDTDIISGLSQTSLTNVVNDLVINGYEQNRDFLTFGGNSITWLDSALVKPNEGSTYYISYNTPKTNEYYEPIECYDIEEVINIAGPIVYNGEINEITLAAQIAKTNGANKVTFVQQNGDTTQAFTEALKKLEDVKVNVLVCPGATTSSLQQLVLNHVVNMSSYTNRAERVAFICPNENATTISQIREQAKGISSDRMVLMFPPTAEVTITDDNGNENIYNVNSTYLGAAICGMMTNVDNDEATPITWANIYGFSGLDGKYYSDAKYNDLTGDGVCCIFNNGSVNKVNQAVTTNTSAIDKVELSIRNIKDTIQYQSRQLFEENFTGKKLVISEIIPKGKSLLKSFCDQKVNGRIFNAYGNINIAQDTQDPRTLLVDFMFKPVFTLTWIKISYSIAI